MIFLQATTTIPALLRSNFLRNDLWMSTIFLFSLNLRITSAILSRLLLLSKLFKTFKTASFSLLVSFSLSFSIELTYLHLLKVLSTFEFMFLKSWISAFSFNWFSLLSKNDESVADFIAEVNEAKKLLTILH